MVNERWWKEKGAFGRERRSNLDVREGVGRLVTLRKKGFVDVKQGMVLTIICNTRSPRWCSH